LDSREAGFILTAVGDFAVLVNVDDFPTRRIESTFRGTGASDLDVTRERRAARSWLGWSQTDLGETRQGSGTVRDYATERRNPIPNNIEAMRRAIEEAGIEFVFDRAGKPAGILVRGASIKRVG
jgi:hypothetical protein